MAGISPYNFTKSNYNDLPQMLANKLNIFISSPLKTSEKTQRMENTSISTVR